ncbi:MAG: hypothetical protein LUD03_01625 [Firmicutes bacterium]|nr:hypothetical protein [Bacillota bacterium]
MMKNKGFRKFVKCAAGFALAAAAYIGTSGPRWWALAWALAFGWIGYNLARMVFARIDEHRRRKARIRKIKNSTAAELEKRNTMRCAYQSARDFRKPNAVIKNPKIIPIFSKDFEVARR